MTTGSEILGSIETGLKQEFERIRNLNYNQNTKGYSYEKTLKVFYTKYLGGIFDFYTRVPLIDAGLEYETIFAHGENEFDVVATYRNALPRMVLEVQGTSFIPYDATAFITEVKQTLTKSSLEEDLEKLGKLSKMKLGGNVHLPNVATPYSIDRPLRILLYYQKEIDEGVLWKMLEESKDVCDFLVMFDQNIAFLNGRLPITKRIVADLKQPEGHPALEQSYPLLKLMYYLTLSIKYPIVVNAWEVFENLFSHK